MVVRVVTIVPVIDLDRPRPLVAADLDEVCRTVGFFQIVGHGVDDRTIKDAWDAIRAFFDLPLADRMSVARAEDEYPYGYIPMAAETLSRSMGIETAPDLKEVFNIGPVDSPADISDAAKALVYSPNLWPDALPELRESWERYYRALLALADRLLSLMAEALGLPSDYFVPMIDESPSALRGLNYPHQAVVPRAGQIRAGAHTDYGMLTILLQDDTPGGLEVLSPTTSHWVPVPSIHGAFVINVGDLLARWTNDRWRSTLHRVVNPTPDASGSTRRQSIAFFHNANYDAVVECLPTCVVPGVEPRYPPVIAGPHLIGKFHRSVYAEPKPS